MQNYSLIQKFFHDLVLKKNFINKSLFEIEKILFLKNKDIKNQSHLFITGMPRSGTTSLLNFIYSSNKYASLTYKNMPFVLSPYLSNLLNLKNILEKERVHGDGIVYNIKSPEAFDEVFFNNNDEFVKNELENFIQLILLSNNKLNYLSKNNLNFKRINLISKILPKAKFLIPIRNPLSQASSLLNQHLHFKRLQKKDDFIRRYMNYLGHFEFGLSHIPWNDPINFKDTNKIDYWLEQWLLFYTKIFINYKNDANCFFIIYEQLSDPNYVNSLLENLNIDLYKNINLNYFKNSNKTLSNNNFSQNLYNDVNDLYYKFENKL